MITLTFTERDYSGAKWEVSLPTDETSNPGSSTATIRRLPDAMSGGMEIKLPTFMILAIASAYVRRAKQERLDGMDGMEVLGL